MRQLATHINSVIGLVTKFLVILLRGRKLDILAPAVAESPGVKLKNVLCVFFGENAV
jgi:hypothetical protein